MDRQEIKAMVVNAFNTMRTLPGIALRTHGADCSTLETFAETMYGVPSYTISYDASEFKVLFKKNALAKRIVDMYPKECWRSLPAVSDGTTPEETQFEKDWTELSSEPRLKLLENLQKADILSGIGTFGILYLGLKDGKNPASPASTTNNELLFLRAFDETNVKVKTFEANKTSERYGLPLTYDILLETNSSAPVEVHWTRVIHIAEEATDSPIYGEPRLTAVIEQVLNITLILKGSPHMFMRGGFPGYSFEAEPDVVITAADREVMEEQIQSYVASMTRFLTLQGVKTNSLAVQLANPDPYIKVQIAMISASTGIPGRLLMGSEMGHLASTADKMTWEDRVHDRQESYLSPSIVKPFIYRLQYLGILAPTEKEIEVTWIRVDSTSQKERAEVSKIKAEALAKYASIPMAAMIVPEEHFLRHFLGFTPGQISDILAGETNLPVIEAEVEEVDDNTPTE